MRHRVKGSPIAMVQSSVVWSTWNACFGTVRLWLRTYSKYEFLTSEGDSYSHRVPKNRAILACRSLRHLVHAVQKTKQKTKHARRSSGWGFNLVTYAPLSTQPA